MYMLFFASGAIVAAFSETHSSMMWSKLYMPYMSDPSRNYVWIKWPRYVNIFYASKELRIYIHSAVSVSSRFHFCDSGILARMKLPHSTQHHTQTPHHWLSLQRDTKPHQRMMLCIVVYYYCLFISIHINSSI
jgi:hypothetical protein